MLVCIIFKERGMWCELFIVCFIVKDLTGSTGSSDG